MGLAADIERHSAVGTFISVVVNVVSDRFSQRKALSALALSVYWSIVQRIAIWVGKSASSPFPLTIGGTGEKFFINT